ncbi:probable cytochrome P450 9f2 [Drosophila obscura]|uniref:probable cytochrome P450 9f2 n=1 Tax=Drosophila obscura TaxID=7282 RepID=UPI001BB27CBF|nr:probable cytochrome P450 9f2 [Drosophila obscura]
MKYRQEHNIIRACTIHMQTEKTKTIVIREWSDCDIVAQCFVFLLAGFETCALRMCFTAQEMMKYEDVQQKLYEGVQQVDIDSDGKELTYEAIMGTKYLDQVVSEV